MSLQIPAILDSIMMLPMLEAAILLIREKGIVNACGQARSRSRFLGCAIGLAWARKENSN